MKLHDIVKQPQDLQVNEISVGLNALTFTSAAMTAAIISCLASVSVCLFKMLKIIYV